jgi:hypothetical protein
MMMIMEKGGEMVKVPESIAGDIMVMNSDDYGLSKDAAAFVTKLCSAKKIKQRNAQWYEVDATDDELVAVVDEVLLEVIAKLNDDLDLYTDGKERAEIRRYITRVQRWIDEYTEEEQ